MSIRCRGSRAYESSTLTPSPAPAGVAAGEEWSPVELFGPVDLHAHRGTSASARTNSDTKERRLADRPVFIPPAVPEGDRRERR
jgi:hypothetical protein